MHNNYSCVSGNKGDKKMNENIFIDIIKELGDGLTRRLIMGKVERVGIVINKKNIVKIKGIESFIADYSEFVNILSFVGYYCVIIRDNEQFCTLQISKKPMLNFN